MIIPISNTLTYPIKLEDDYLYFYFKTYCTKTEVLPDNFLTIQNQLENVIDYISFGNVQPIQLFIEYPEHIRTPPSAVKLLYYVKVSISIFKSQFLLMNSNYPVTYLNTNDLIILLNSVSNLRTPSSLVNAGVISESSLKLFIPEAAVISLALMLVSGRLMESSLVSSINSRLIQLYLNV